MKRQLPQWMLGVCSGNQVNATDSSRNNCNKDIEDGRVERVKKRKQSCHTNSGNDMDCERVEGERKGCKNRGGKRAKFEVKTIECENKEIVEAIDDSSRNSCNKDIEDGRVEREPKGLKKRKQSSHTNSGNDIDCERVEGEPKGCKNRGDKRDKFEEKTIECENKEIVKPIDPVKGKPPRSRLVKCRETKQTTENASSYVEMSKKKKNSGKATEHIIIKNGEDVASTDCSDNEDNEDLTLEDLMVIANEYIEEDDNSNQVDLSKDDMPVNQFQGTADSQGSLGAPPVGSRLIEATERNYSCNSTVDQSSSGNSFKPNQSLNPTQSLLDIFLGPLPEITQEKEKKSESKIDKWDLEFEAYKQKNVLVEKKPVTTTTTLGKKKSSLKDKVMMFLD